jgi:hypothetical protein
MTLSGSDKQIAWAEQIRDTFAADLALLRERLASGTQPGYFVRFLAVYEEELAVIEQQAAAQTNASWWINNGLKRAPEPMLAARIRARQRKS